jgi:transcriptional regulator with XRE-family HTH domain
MERLGVSDEAMAGLLNVGRETVWKRYTEQKRLDPEKIQEFADALNMHPSELLFPPGTPSLDAIIDGANNEQRQMAADIVRRMINKAS